MPPSNVPDFVADPALPFLAGGGDMGARIRAHDWAQTPLGPPDGWPSALRVTLGICLNSNVPTAIYWGDDLRLLYNDAWAPIPAEKHPWALGRPAREVWPDIWAVIGPQFADVLSSGLGFSTFDQMLPMERGGRIERTHWNYSFTPIRDERGAIVGIFNQGHETTDQVRTRTELEESQRRIELALGASSRVGTWHWDIVANRLSADPRFADLYGVSVAEAREGAPLERYTSNIHPEDLPAVSAAIAHALRTGDVLSEEYRLLQADGSVKWVVAQGRVAFAADGTPESFPGVVYDITAMKQAQLHAEEQLRQAQKMEAIGQLTGGIAHDFNNLLSGIAGWLSVLQVRVTQGRTDDLARYVALARNATRRASTLTHRLLAFSRKQALAPRLLAVDRLVREMEDLIHRSVGPDIALEVRVDGDTSTARVDPNQLESALLNLCINARDAMPGGGRIGITVAEVDVDGDEARRLDVLVGAYVRLRVTDTGHGMTPQVAARVFEPFFTTKPLGQGTGLGLSMVYGFARQSGGAVEIASQPGAGTTVDLYLPRQAGEAEAVERLEGRRAPSHAGVGLRVLVVDDEPTVRLLVAEILSDYGYSTIEAGDADAALPVLQSNTRIDVLVTDVGLRGALRGPDLAAAARAVRPDLGVLFVTGYADARGLETLPPRTRLLLKPFEPDDLALTVHELVSGA